MKSAIATTQLSRNTMTCQRHPGARRSILGAGLLAAVAAIALFAAPQVHAQAIGFVWNNNPTKPGTTTPTSEYSYNSSGGGISITRHSKGNYTVDFAGLGNSLNSDVQVNGYGADSDFCNVEGWGGNGTDVEINVLCYTKAGVATDHFFTLLYQARTSSDATKPTVAFLWANQPTTASYTPSTTYQYNVTGGTNTITRSGTGNYSANLPGLTTTGGTVIVTAYGGSPTHCQVTDWNSGGSGTNVNVNCTNTAGVATDSMFDLVYSINETAGYGSGSTGGGAIWAFDDTDKTAYDVSGTYSIAIDGEPMYAQRLGIGRYAWTMTVNDTGTSSTGLATAYDAPGNYCTTKEWESTSTTTTVYINCYTAAGKPANTRFTATLQLAGVF